MGEGERETVRHDDFGGASSEAGDGFGAGERARDVEEGDDVPLGRVLETGECSSSVKPSSSSDDELTGVEAVRGVEVCEYDIAAGVERAGCVAGDYSLSGSNGSITRAREKKKKRSERGGRDAGSGGAGEQRGLGEGKGASRRRRGERKACCRCPGRAGGG